MRVASSVKDKPCYWADDFKLAHQIKYVGHIHINHSPSIQKNLSKFRGKLKENLFVAMIKQFLTDVYWGDLDYLIIDTPPGTSDEHITVVENIKQHNPDGAILVTTPQVSKFSHSSKVFKRNLFWRSQQQILTINCWNRTFPAVYLLNRFIFSNTVFFYLMEYIHFVGSCCRWRKKRINIL